MTNRESIKVFNKWMDCKDAYQADPSCDGNCFSCEYYASAEEEKEAMQMAISALEKQSRIITVTDAEGGLLASISDKDIIEENGVHVIISEE